MPVAGLEPARLLNRLILSQVRLPIPPQRHGKWFIKTEVYDIISVNKKQVFSFCIESKQ